VIGEKFAETYAAITRGTRERGKTLNRMDVVVSYLDGAGKSGPEMARKFRTTNNIAFDNVLEIAELGDAVARLRPAAIIFVDDFVATGDSVVSGLDRIDPSVVDTMRSGELRTGFACVAGFQAGLENIKSALNSLGVKARVHAGETLTDADRCFHPKSRFFTTETERASAELIAKRAGELLDKRQPLGFEGSQAAVVFEASCPNNTLPILWAKRGNWRPLFPRL
jgi:hypothetical protein